MEDIRDVYELVLKGLALGTITAFSFGPVFFSIIDTSMRRGVRFALSVALGVLISDAIMITICFLSIGQIIQDTNVRNIIGAIGGCVLVIFGIYHIARPVHEVHPKDIQPSNWRMLLYMLKGFAINSINPFVLIFWLSAVSFVAVDNDYNKAEKIFFFVMALGFNFCYDTIKSFLASRLKHLLTHKTMNIISKVVGIGILIFGVRLLWKTLVPFL